MIRRQNQQIVLTEQRQKLAQLFIKFLDLFPISYRISAMPPQRIKIYQIGKAKSLEIPLCDTSVCCMPCTLLSE